MIGRGGGRAALRVVGATDERRTPWWRRLGRRHWLGACAVLFAVGGAVRLYVPETGGPVMATALLGVLIDYWARLPPEREPDVLHRHVHVRRPW